MPVGDRVETPQGLNGVHPHPTRPLDERLDDDRCHLTAPVLQ
jgi:hypothetical protein